MTETIPGPAYRIRTERLILRCWNPTDAELLNQTVQESQEHLQPWMPWARGELPSLQERINWLRRCRGEFDLGEDFVYGIFDSSERRVLGGSGLHTRLGAGRARLAIGSIRISSTRALPLRQLLL